MGPPTPHAERTGESHPPARMSEARASCIPPRRSRFNGEAMPPNAGEIAPHPNIKALVPRFPLAADGMNAFGLGCSGCGVSKYETVEQGARAHGLHVEPILEALERARGTGTVPPIAEADLRPARRAPGAFAKRAAIAHTIPIMSGKGGVGKSLVTALLAIGLRRKHYRVGILDADITGPSIPKLFGLTQPLTIEADPVRTTPQGQPQPLMTPAR